jgi:pantoate kinase
MTPASVTAFCPGHISGYFRRVDSHELPATGSIGAGIVIDEGVRATVSRAKYSSIIIRAEDTSGALIDVAHDSPPIVTALSRIGVIAAVTTTCRLPIGAGFGLSAAALLATLAAANQLFECGMSPAELAEIAHETEVLHKTGLGDVAACQGGGRVIRTGPGIGGPILRHFDMAHPIYAVSFGPIPTPSVLGSPSQMQLVTAAFPKITPQNVEEFFRCSREFSDASGLETPEVKNVLAVCDRHHVPASMTMLGNGVFAYGTTAEPALRKFGRVFRMQMAQKGVRVEEDTS